MWFYYVSYVVITCIFFTLCLCFILCLHVPSHILFKCDFCPHPTVLYSHLSHLSLYLHGFTFFFYSIKSFILSLLFSHLLHSTHYSSLVLFSSLFLLIFKLFILCALIRPVRYQRQQCSAWLPVRSLPWPSSAQCHTGTSSRPVSRERWNSHCRSDTCFLACFPTLMPELDLQHGASLLPSDRTSPGRVYLFLRNRTLGVAWAAGGWSRAFVSCWLRQSI